VPAWAERARRETLLPSPVAIRRSGATETGGWVGQCGVPSAIVRVTSMTWAVEEWISTGGSGRGLRTED
jgi:hypothetical protein